MPADHKWFTRLVVAGAIIDALEDLDLQYPTVDEHKREELRLVQTELEGRATAEKAKKKDKKKDAKAGEDARSAEGRDEGHERRTAANEEADAPAGREGRAGARHAGACRATAV